MKEKHKATFISTSNALLLHYESITYKLTKRTYFLVYNG